MTLFATNRRAKIREEIALIKARYLLSSIAEALRPASAAVDECPNCYYQPLKVNDARGRAYCESCKQGFDHIALVQASRGCGVAAACDWIVENSKTGQGPRSVNGALAKGDGQGRLF